MPPKKLTRKKVGERKEKHIKHHEAIVDENGHVIKEAHDEEIEVIVPIIDTVYEEMSDEEIEALSNMENLPHEKSPEERLSELENTVKHLTDEINKLKDEKPKPK